MSLDRLCARVREIVAVLLVVGFPAAGVAQEDNGSTVVEATPTLTVGESVEGRITATDRVVETAELALQFAPGSPRGTAYRAAVDTSATYRLRVESAFFIPYLIVRDAAGEVIAEDKSARWTVLPEIVQPLAVGKEYRVEVVSVYGDPGPFTLMLDAHDANAAPDEGAVAWAEAARKRVESSPDATAAARGTVLHHLGHARDVHGDLDGAIDAFERAIRIKEEAPSEREALAGSLNCLGYMLDKKGKFSEAKRRFERMLAIREEVLGPRHAAVAVSLRLIANCKNNEGDYTASRRLHERALELFEATAGPDHPTTAVALGDFAYACFRQGDLASTRPLLERALAIFETTPGQELAAANVLNSLSMVAKAQGDFEGAIAFLDRAIRINEVAYGPEHPATALNLYNLASLLKARDDGAQARPHFERALAIFEATFGAAHFRVGQCLNSLGTLGADQGDHEEAIALYVRSLRIFEQALGADHPETMTALNNLAVALQDIGRYEEARSYLERCLQSVEARTGPMSPGTATILNNLATCLDDMGEIDSARALHERALRIREATLGPEHPDTAGSLLNLAETLRRQGDRAGARGMMQRAHRVHRLVYGDAHWRTAKSLSGLALMEYEAGDREAAVARSMAAVASGRARRLEVLWTLTESARLRFAKSQLELLRTLLTAAKGSSPKNERAAYESVLQWKAHVLRSLSQTRGQALSKLSEDGDRLVEALVAVQKRLSTEMYRPSVADRDEHQELLSGLRAERQRLEMTLNRSVGAADEEPMASVTDLSRSLPADSVLVDFFVHPHYVPARAVDGEAVEPGRWGAPRLSAWVLRAGSDGSPDWLDLGQGSEIEAATKDFLAQLVGSRGGVPMEEEGESADRVDSRLRGLLWDPIAAKIGEETTRVFVSPDSFLGGLPFEVLQEEDGRYLIERLAFVYRQDAASLARADDRATTGAVSSSLLCVGGVDYRRRADVEDADLASEDRGGFRKRWSPLPGTRDEALAIGDLHHETFADAERVVLLGRDATEERVKSELERHRVVHLATHGFFQPDGLPSMWEKAQFEVGGDGLVMRTQKLRLTGALPGLLSGLALAGANKPPEDAGRDDGILLAEELSFLDLTRADLVVLSACESGLGRPQSGEGLLGFRRTLRAAGARTVISSLWRVSDEATNELMQGFYERMWLGGESKLDALRNAQLEMLQQNRLDYDGQCLPSTWGAFVLDGEPE